MHGTVSWSALRAQYDPEFVWMCSLPYNGAYLVRMFPAGAITAMEARGERASISGAVTHATRNYRLAPGGSPSGVLYLQPDWASAYSQLGGTTKRIEVMASWVDEGGNHVPECARSTLGSLARFLQHEHGLTLLLGFEVEVVFMACQERSASCSEDNILTTVESAVRALGKAGLEVRQFHAELARHQWEFVLGPAPPVEAVDGLVRARRVLASVASAHGVRATLHPRPVPTDVGTGSHVHISAAPNSTFRYTSPTGACGQTPNTDSFFAGILHHLRAVAAFTMPLDASYRRVRPGIWSGGEYVCWGWQNREAPLRRISANRFEIKAMCGTANPYLALTALLAAGLDGMRQRLTLADGCQLDPSSLSDAQRQHLGIHHRLPATIGESLDALEQDPSLHEVIGVRLVAAYSAVTRAWDDYLQSLGEEERNELLLKLY
ncbi:hypothetical protein HIM_08333 [Hirsutella minnesotensis 3608]|uniref:GS catalytic domain-containing protein n=1 Tax=Hirsutella minnesotensis 3608 TaxID=1043627 RepID=A0A0F7ZYD7_9HYPO|nr:hypothetical protein HIM_08333 [Hirsutella minnesotensis 3608]